MSSLGDPIHRQTSASDLLRTVINEILELKNKSTGGKTPPRTLFITDIGKVLLSHTEPVITTTTAATDVYDAASAVYDTSEYA